MDASGVRVGELRFLAKPHGGGQALHDYGVLGGHGGRFGGV